MKLWSDVRTRDQLLKWAEQGLLTRAELEQSLGTAQLQPSPKQWLLALDRVLAIYGILLLAMGSILFFAFNWDALHYIAKLGLACAALSGFAGLAWLCPVQSVLYRLALFACALTTGGLLALVGQIYQTGADTWQLFAVWALLIIPWALLSRSSACWALLWLIINIALLRYFSLWSGGAEKGSTPLIGVLQAIAVTNALMLLIAEMFGARQLRGSHRVVMRLCGLAVLAALVVAASRGWWSTEFRWAWIGLSLVCLIGIPVYRWVRPDWLLLTLQIYAVITVLAFGLTYGLDDASEVIRLIIPGVFVLILSALFSVWFQRLLQRPHR